MTEIFSSFENILILYAPTLLMYISQMVDWFVTLRSFKRLDVGAQVAPVLKQVKDCTDEVKKLDKKFKEFDKEKEYLGNVITDLKTSINAQNAEICELKQYLKSAVDENIELKALIRRELKCAVKEHESV